MILSSLASSLDRSVTRRRNAAYSRCSPRSRSRYAPCPPRPPAVASLGGVVPDVLPPDVGVFAPEPLHEIHAAGVVEDDDLHPVGPQEFLVPAEGPVLADHDP